jgi:hypothetical protein
MVSLASMASVRSKDVLNLVWLARVRSIRRPFVGYFASGNVRDVRMVEDGQ